MDDSAVQELAQTSSDLQTLFGDDKAVERFIFLAAHAPATPADWFWPDHPNPCLDDAVENMRRADIYRQSMWPWAWARHLMSAVRRIDELEMPQFDLLPPDLVGNE